MAELCNCSEFQLSDFTRWVSMSDGVVHTPERCGRHLSLKVDCSGAFQGRPPELHVCWPRSRCAEAGCFWQARPVVVGNEHIRRAP